MLIAALLLLALAVLLGSALSIVELARETMAAAPWRLAALHGIVGLAGLACLVLALSASGPAPAGHGTERFGLTSAWLFGLAALVGTMILAARLRRRRVGTLIAMHATVAISAFVIFAAYIFVR